MLRPVVRGDNNSSPCGPSESGWLRFYEGSSKGVRFLCDCFRLPPRVPNDCCDQTVENRVYYGGERSNSFHLAYIQWFGQSHMPRGNLDLHHALHASNADAIPLPCNPGHGAEFGWAWARSVIDLVESLGAARPTHMILNAGLWRTSNLTKAFWHALASAGAHLQSRHGTRILWRTTPRHEFAQLSWKMSGNELQPWKSFTDVDIKPFVDAGWEIYDAAELVRQFATAQRLTSDQIYLYDRIHLADAANEILAQHVEKRVLGCCESA